MRFQLGPSRSVRRRCPWALSRRAFRSCTLVGAAAGSGGACDGGPRRVAASFGASHEGEHPLPREPTQYRGDTVVSGPGPSNASRPTTARRTPPVPAPVTSPTRRARVLREAPPRCHASCRSRSRGGVSAPVSYGGCGVTVSVRVMSAGDGYRYLLRTVAAGDGVRSLSTPLTRYYAEEGTPPGFWMGSAMSAVGAGALAAGGVVTEQQLQLLLGMGRDPVDGSPLGRAYPEYAPVSERVLRRTAELDERLSDAERASAIERIEVEERAAGSRRAVAGYDFTFSVPKSVSTLWAVWDAVTQARIVALHHQAVAEVVDFLEREIAATRTGVAAGDGAVAQVATTGVIAAAYDHYDSRAGDPHLHTHVVVSNKVKTVLDGRWRSLDGRPLLASAVALSELHEGLVADLITAEFGLGWVPRERGTDRNPVWDVEGVPTRLLEEFSSRASEIDREKDRLITAYLAVHGRQPSAATVLRLRAQATLSTRPAKQVQSLADLTGQWRQRAGQVLARDAAEWAAALTAPQREIAPRPELSSEQVEQLAGVVVSVVGEKRSTWRHWNLHAEASRQLKGIRFAGLHEREAATALVVKAAERASLRLTPPELAAVPLEFQRPDGSSVFRPRHSALYTSPDLLAAERRLLERSRQQAGPKASAKTVTRVIASRRGRRLSVDQADAVTAIAGSGRQVDVLVGPAGAGKTTTMTALRQVWEVEYGRGRVVGLAPSAAAADVLGQELGITTENTAKWFHDHTIGSVHFQAGQLVVIDEASLAGTRTLDAITAHAEEVGAKVLLVGDWAQLQAVDAGGAFSLLVHDRDDVPELADVHRFSHGWERTASLHLRHGRAAAIDAYLTHGRIRGGETDQISDAAYQAWSDDRDAGKASLLVAPTREIVTALNERARAQRILTGDVVTGREAMLPDGARASIGDEVITRRNERTLHAGRTGWVRNGDRWTVKAVHADGAVTLRRSGYRRGATIRLPRAYVSEHLDLGYAVTGYGAQGMTVDTAHAIVTSGTTREQLYVALTRGRHGNTAYVATDRPDHTHAQRHPGENPDLTAVAVLHGVLRHSGAERSAHETITAEHEHWGSIAQLAAEYETIAAAAQHDRWTALIRATPLSPEQADAVIDSDAFGPLAAELRRAEAYHHDVDRLVPRLVAARGFENADDAAAVLHQRLAAATARSAGTPRARPMPRLIAGLIPEATGPMTASMRRALHERRNLIEARADMVLQRAVEQGEPWTAGLGPVPSLVEARRRWTVRARAVAAYRDRYAVDDTEPLGQAAAETAQQRERAQLMAADVERNTPEHGGSEGLAPKAAAVEVANALR